jgi:hypothetical protein
MQSIHLKSALLGFSFAMLIAGLYAFSSPDTAPSPAPSLSNRAMELPASGWTDLGGAIYSPSEGIYQVVYGDFGNGDEFTIVEVVGFD